MNRYEAQNVVINALGLHGGYHERTLAERKAAITLLCVAASDSDFRDKRKRGARVLWRAVEYLTATVNQ